MSQVEAEDRSEQSTSKEFYKHYTCKLWEHSSHTEIPLVLDCENIYTYCDTSWI